MAWTQTAAAPTSDLQSSIEAYSEVVANDQDKSFDPGSDGNAPAYEVLGLRIEYAAGAPAGTRQFGIEIKDSAGDVIFELSLSSNTDITAGNSLNIEMSPGAVNTAAVNGTAIEFLPVGLWLRTGDVFRVFARAGADAGDDMVLHLRLKGLSPHS